MKKEKLADKSQVCLNRISKYVSRDDFSLIRDELRIAPCTTYKLDRVNDVIFRSGTEKNKDRTNLLNEKYILRHTFCDEAQVELIKECSRGGMVKSITEKISAETALRIIERSTKWLCTSISPLLRELGVKMTTERLRPEEIVSFSRESFNIENRLCITADSSISLCGYKEGLDLDRMRKSEPVDDSICLLQINYERIIPEYISSLIGIKSH